MTLEFQEELLKFLVQNNSAKKYVELLEDKVFDLPEYQLSFDAIKAFYKKYNTAPSQAQILEFFDIQITNTNSDVPKEQYNIIANTLRGAYEPFGGSVDFVRERLVEKYQIKLMKEMFASKMLDLKNGAEEVIQDIYRNAKTISDLSSYDEEEENNKGSFALAEFTKGKRTAVDAQPTYLKALNRLTSTGGFYSPQLVIFMGPPKSFKTGTALNIAMNYTKAGLRVYYVDCENGEERINDRLFQSMLKAEWSEYNSGDLDDILEEMVQKYKIMGGEFLADYYPAHTKSTADVEDRLQELKELKNWEPDVIIWDYPDLMKPEDYRIKEKRLQIQAVYHDIIRLQKRRNVFGIGLSQVNKEAVNKKVIDMTNFSEDFGKAANCHACFALCRTKDEKKAGVMRIVPVIQRDGANQETGIPCFVKVSEAIMDITEIDKDQWKMLTKEAEDANRSGKVKSKAPRTPIKPVEITDE